MNLNIHGNAYSTDFIELYAVIEKMNTVVIAVRYCAPRRVKIHELTEALSQTPDSIIAYESRLRKMIDEKTNIDDAKHNDPGRGSRRRL